MGIQMMEMLSICPPFFPLALAPVLGMANIKQLQISFFPEAKDYNLQTWK